MPATTEVLEAYALSDDDCALARLLTNAALVQCEHFKNVRAQYEYVCTFLKRQLDTTLVPLAGNVYGEWSTVVLERGDGWYARIVCSMYAALYVQRWRRTLLLFYC